MLERFTRFLRGREKQAPIPETNNRDWERRMAEAGFTLDHSFYGPIMEHRRRTLKAALSSDDLIRALTDCVPVSSKDNFFNTQNFSDILHLIDLLKDQGPPDIEITDLAQTAQRVKQVMAYLDAKVIAVDEPIVEIIQFVVKLVRDPLSYQLLHDDPAEVAALIAHSIETEKFYRIHARYDSLMAVLRADEDTACQIVAHGGSLMAETFLDNYYVIKIFSQYPELLELSVQAINGELGWHARIQALARSFQITKIGDVSQDELEEILLRQYANQRAVTKIKARYIELSALGPQEFWDLISKRDPRKDPLAAEYFNLCLTEALSIASLAPERRFGLLLSIWRKIDQTKVELLRHEIRGTSEHHANITKRQSELEQTLSRVEYMEDDRHPANSLGLARLTGFEIEYPRRASKIDPDSLHSFHELIGIHRGGGGLDCDELSPGPFNDPRTGIEVFRQFRQAGLITTLGEHGHTVHFNTAINSESSTIPTMIWSLYATGAAYGPEFTQDKYDKYDENERTFNLGIYSRDSESGAYTECKAFDLMTAEGFEWNYTAAATLSCAAGAYQDILDNLGLKFADKKAIRRSTVDPYRKQLALIWLRFDRTMTKGFAALGIGKQIHETEIPLRSIRLLDREVALVYPTVQSRYQKDRSITAGEELPTTQIRDANKTWPNIVTFATNTIEATVKEIRSVLASVETDALADVARIEATSDDETKSNLIGQFVEKYRVKVRGDDIGAAYRLVADYLMRQPIIV